MTRILAAADYARLSHMGQLRKYSLDPYIVHPARVAAFVSTLSGVGEDEVIAAWLHDVCEDCDTSPDEVGERFGPRVAMLVTDLTNPSKTMPRNTPRAEKKAVDMRHLRGVSDWAKRIKLVDRWDNLRDMHGAPADFAKLYAGESMALANAIAAADPEMAALVYYECGRLTRSAELRHG